MTKSLGISDDTLTLYFYNDGLSAAERQVVASALAADTDVAARYRELSATLAALDDGADTRPLPEDLLVRLHDTIDRAAAADVARAPAAPPGPLHFGSFLWGAALTAALAVGVGIGFWLGTGDDGAPDTLIAEPAAAGIPARAAFSRRVQVYFRDSRDELAGLPLDSDADRILLVAELIEQNRLLEKAAEHSNSPGLARVLRAFEPVLLQLADDDITSEDAEALRARLSFQLNVMLTKLARESSEQVPDSEQRSTTQDTQT